MSLKNSTPAVRGGEEAEKAEDGIRDSVASRGLGDVYKRQGMLYVLSKHIVEAGIGAPTDISRLKCGFKKKTTRKLAGGRDPPS